MIKQLLLLRNISILIVVVMVSSYVQVSAQEDQLTVEGKVQIRGNLDIHHPQDSTSFFIGHQAGSSYTTINAPLFNTMVGQYSGTVSTGSSNSFLGNFVGVQNQGNNNSFFGYGSGSLNQGNENTLMGYLAGAGHITGGNNSFLGSRAGGEHEDGADNSFFGQSAGTGSLAKSRGEKNVFIGKGAGNHPFTGMIGSRNTFIGVNAKQQTPEDSLVRTIAIGYGAEVDCDNCAVIGGTGTEAVKVGINQPHPLTSLHVKGDIQVDNGKYEGWGILTLNTDVDNTGDDFVAFLNSGGSEVARFHTNGFMGIGTTSPDDALDVVGDIDVTDCITTDDGNIVGGDCGSDRRYKKDITDLENQLDKVLSLRPVRYDWKDSEKNGSESQIGFIAQEVEKVIPEMVISDERGNKQIRYDISLQIRMIKALQERQLKINTQQAELDLLRDEINALKSMIKPGSN